MYLLLLVPTFTFTFTFLKCTYLYLLSLVPTFSKMYLFAPTFTCTYFYWCTYCPIESYQYHMKRSLFPSFANRGERPSDSTQSCLGIRRRIHWLFRPFWLIYTVHVSLWVMKITEGRGKKIVRKLHHTLTFFKGRETIIFFCDLVVRDKSISYIGYGPR